MFIAQLSLQSDFVILSSWTRQWFCIVPWFCISFHPVGLVSGLLSDLVIYNLPERRGRERKYSVTMWCWHWIDIRLNTGASHQICRLGSTRLRMCEIVTVDIINPIQSALGFLASNLCAIISITHLICVRRFHQHWLHLITNTLRYCTTLTWCSRWFTFLRRLRCIGWMYVLQFLISSFSYWVSCCLR